VPAAIQFYYGQANAIVAQALVDLELIADGAGHREVHIAPLPFDVLDTPGRFYNSSEHE
jgi:hypothetical protein